MLMPSKVKFRKQQRGRRRGLAQRGAEVSFGDYGLKVMRAGWITARQIEASRGFSTTTRQRLLATVLRAYPDLLKGMTDRVAAIDDASISARPSMRFLPTVPTMSAPTG